MSFLAIFFTSFSLLSYEILLMRLLSIQEWSHYAYMVVSLAMLGVGFSGIIIFLFSEFFKNHRETIIFISLLLFTFSISLSFSLNAKLPLNSLYIVWDPHQFIYLACSYFLYAVPFFFASIVIATFFSKFPKRTGWVYGVNLFGSGAGVVGAIGGMYLLAPEDYLTVTAIISTGAIICFAFTFRDRGKKIISSVMVPTLVFFILQLRSPTLPISEYKALSYLLRLPGNKIIGKLSSPLGVIHIIEGKTIRLATALSMNFTGQLPPQKAITVDGDSPVPVLGFPKDSIAIEALESTEKLNSGELKVESRGPESTAPLSTVFHGAESRQKRPLSPDRGRERCGVGVKSGRCIIPSEWNYLDQKIYAVGYHLLKNPKVLIIGPGGGEEILLAHYHGCSSVTALEMNPDMVYAVDTLLKDFSSRPYSMPGTRVIIREARGYLEQTDETFDLIQFNLLGSFISSASGVYAQNEDYLNTIESYELLYRRLSTSGIITITRWMKTPARDGIKLMTTAYYALKKLGVSSPGKHISLIRNWDTVTLLIKRSPFTEEDIKILKDFCQSRNFDLCYFDGIKINEVNRFNVLPEPIYYKAASVLLNPQISKHFFETYPFNVEPATDDKPYFSNFFRWRAFPYLVKTYGKEWLPFVEYGYLVLLATFTQAILIGGLFILFPTIVLLRVSRRRNFNSSVWCYFMTLGFSFMILEMALIQKFILFLSHPVYSVVVVISSFLLFSGCGSLLSKRLTQHNKLKRVAPFVVVILLGVFYTFTLNILFSYLAWMGTAMRVITSFLLIAPLSFFMGMPFPLGMGRIVTRGEKSVGIAWGFNGYTSVIGAVSAPLLGSIIGFKMVGLLGCGGYLFAMWIWSQKWET